LRTISRSAQSVSVQACQRTSISSNGPSPSIRHRIEASARRAAFERAWREIEPRVTEADRAEERRERAHTAWKYHLERWLHDADADGGRSVTMLLRRRDR